MTRSKLIRSVCSRVAFVLLPVLLAVAPLQAIGADRSHPGYVDFERLTGLEDADAVVDVRLDGWLLGLAREAALESGDEDARILSDIDSIRVRIYDNGVDFEEFERSASSMIRDMRRDGWEDFTTVRGDDGSVYVMVLGDESQLDGVTIVATDDGSEAVFVNIAGSLRAKDLGRLLANSDITGVDLDLDW